VPHVIHALFEERGGPIVLVLIDYRVDVPGRAANEERIGIQSRSAVCVI